MGQNPDQSAEEAYELEIWPDAMKSFEVLLRCRPELVGAGFGVIHGPATSQEIDAAIRLMLMPRKHWPTILDDVQYMSSVSARIKNEDNKNRPIPKNR